MACLLIISHSNIRAPVQPAAARSAAMHPTPAGTVILKCAALHAWHAMSVKTAIKEVMWKRAGLGFDESKVMVKLWTIASFAGQRAHRLV